jgi:hypothetical protein
MTQTRFDGTVAVWYSSHFQAVDRDWKNIEQFGGVYHPALGYYDHQTKETLNSHLRWMRRAGIDCIVYDVYGFDKWGPMDIEKDRVLHWLMEALENQQGEPRKLQLVIWLERYASNPGLEEYRHALNFVRQNLAEQPYYFRYQGRPLVVTYLNGDSKDIDELEWENQYFNLRRIRPYHSDVWSYIEFWPQKLNREWMSACPGLDPYMENAYLANKREPNPDLTLVRKNSIAVDRKDGDYFKKQLLRARQGDPSILFISGWNDWQYGCQIEPAVEYGFRYVDLAAQVLGREAETRPYREAER